MARLVRLTAALSAVAILLFSDIQTKSWAADELRRSGPRTVARGQMRFQYLENHGIAFGFFRDNESPHRQRFIVAYASAVTIGLALVLARLLGGAGASGFAMPAGVSAMLAGTLGNLYDRLERGFVVDFIHFSAGGRIRWPVFNFADIFLAVGMILCLFGLLRLLFRPPGGGGRARRTGAVSG